MSQERAQLYFFFLLFVGILLLTFFMFLPFLSVIAVAAVFAVLFYPVYQRVLRRVRGRKNLAATITFLGALGVVFVPLTLFTFLLFQEARDLYLLVNENGLGHFSEPMRTLEMQIERIFPGVEFDVRSYIGQATRWLAQEFGGIFAGTASALLGFFLGTMAFYYFLRDGDRMMESVKHYSPLDDTYDNEIIAKLNATIHSVVSGSLSIALIQGIFTSVGLTIFGVPNPVLWGGVAAIGALIPMLGTMIVLVPAVGYLLLVGSVGGAIGLAIWGVAIVGLVDNLLMPRLVGRGVPVHPLWIIFAVFGGLAFFGPLGFFLGPLVMTMLLVLGHIYSTLIQAK